MDHVLCAVGASKTFSLGVERVVALDDVSLSVTAGEVLCVYGASGSGKTTLLNVLGGIETPDTGSVVVLGRELSVASESARADARLHDIGVIFQSNNLLPEFSALENVMIPCLARGVSRQEADRSGREALAALGLGGLEHRRPADMSGGQRQRVGIARVLAGGQRVLLADEPTGALDSASSRRLFRMLRELARDHGTTIVIATHDPLAEEVADSIVDMVDGRLTTR